MNFVDWGFLVVFPGVFSLVLAVAFGVCHFRRASAVSLGVMLLLMGGGYAVATHLTADDQVRAIAEGLRRCGLPEDLAKSLADAPGERFPLASGEQVQALAGDGVAAVRVDRGIDDAEGVCTIADLDAGRRPLL